MGSCRAELVSVRSWVKPWASLQLGENPAGNGVSRGVSAGPTASRELNSIKASEDSLLCVSKLPPPYTVSLQTLNEATRCHLQMGKLRPGGADQPKATSRPTANTPQTLQHSHPPGLRCRDASFLGLMPKMPPSSTAFPPPPSIAPSSFTESTVNGKHIPLQKQNPFGQAWAHPIHTPL